MGATTVERDAKSVNGGTGSRTTNSSRISTPPGAQAGGGSHQKRGGHNNYAPHIPLSQRRAPPLNLSTVERLGTTTSLDSKQRQRPHNLQEAPTFYPSVTEFRDPYEYIQKIRAQAEQYGICKIVPPKTWSPDFAIDTERFFFKTRRQQMNSVEGSTRTNLQYVDQLAKFHKQNGMNLNRFPSVDKRPLDLYRLKKAVEARGGFEMVCKVKKWAEIGRDLGYSGKIMSSLSTSLKNSYQKWLLPYEEYLKVAKSGNQQHADVKHLLNSSAKPESEHSARSTSNVINGTSSEGKEEASKAREEEGPTATNAEVVAKQEHEESQAFISTHESSNGSDPEATIAAAADHDSPLKIGSQFTPVNGEHSQRLQTKSVTQSRSDSSNRLKRSISQSVNDPATCIAHNENDERKSKRNKKAPTIAGSHVNPQRSFPGLQGLQSSQASIKGDRCEVCGTKDDRSALLTCDGCDASYHLGCLDSPVLTHPVADWHCTACLVGTGEFGFEEGGIYSLKQFQEKASQFKNNYFELRKSVSSENKEEKHEIGDDEVEKEFWRLVESPSEDVEVEYGADIHSTLHGSGFPTIERDPSNPYSTNYWNLNILPFHPDSLFRHIKSDISGMTNPWLYVGMCFSTFCWHNEDHYCYSANYQHFGATKTWYGIPGADAERFETVMREAVPELFETQPDLLFQLVTLLPPDRLKRAGVNVYALDQQAGQFVITFPQAYHAGFNHGFNFNEAVNFAPDDWEPFGRSGTDRFQDFRKQPCFSHDELLISVANRDRSIKTAKWLGPALRRLQVKELQRRRNFRENHNVAAGVHQCLLDGAGIRASKCESGFSVLDEDLPEADCVCATCKAYTYLSTFHCKKSGLTLCLDHVKETSCCDTDENHRFNDAEHILQYRILDNELDKICQRLEEKAQLPGLWTKKLAETLETEERPALKALQALANEADRIPWPLKGLENLKTYLAKCNDWVEEAQHYLARKNQNRRKNERVWRKNRPSMPDIGDESDKELRDVSNIARLLDAAEELAFDSPQIAALQARAQAIEDIRSKARSALADPGAWAETDLEELAESGRGFNVDLPEIENLALYMKRQKWGSEAANYVRSGQYKFKNTEDVKHFITRGQELSILETDHYMIAIKDLQARAEAWEARAQDVMSSENILHHQLEALANQSLNLPISDQSRARIEAILSKQREAQRAVQGMVERTRHADLRHRPMYKEARSACDAIASLNSKPVGSVDLENTLKRHENWMRKGKKLFGKANAPLHILQQHLEYVAQHNSFCFDLLDKPRLPVEPASRENSPVAGESDELGALKSEKNVFCMCRQAEAGTMLECERCLEWYHGKCLKIARGKVKEDDKYLCPICDYRVKIPRDAARPKLEDLLLWQDEINDLPFQPEEESTINQVVRSAQNFRDFLQPHVNPLMSSSEELTTQRFYLRKLEGAEVLLTFETNFFRQELHRWAPVATTPPPILEHSLSTRKPRPTKQQRLLTQHGVEKIDDLPPELRPKSLALSKARESEATKQTNLKPAPAQASRASQSILSTKQALQPHLHDTPFRQESPSVESHGASMRGVLTTHPGAFHPPEVGSIQDARGIFDSENATLAAAREALEADPFGSGTANPFEHARSILRTDSPIEPYFSEPMHDTAEISDLGPEADKIFDEFVSHPEEEPA